MGRILVTVVLAAALTVAAVACGGDAASDGSDATPAAAPAESVVPTGPATADAAALFADDCAGCHGGDGSGGTGPDLRAEDDVARVKSQIESGGGAMPSFSSQLPPDQIDALAQYVVTELD
jgi:mono/diheme cytochrome c family protein